MLLKPAAKLVRRWLAPREAVELGPIEQLALRHLLEIGGCAIESVYREVAANRVATREMIDEALTRLVSEGLVESRIRSEGGLFFSTKKGAKLHGRIPPEPHTVFEFWL